MSDSEPGELLPTWEQLLSGVGVGASGRSPWRFSSVTPRHVRAWPEDWSTGWSMDWSTDWEDRWAGLVRELQHDDGMPWREAWAWTALVTACAAAVSYAASLLR